MQANPPNCFEYDTIRNTPFASTYAVDTSMAAPKERGSTYLNEACCVKDVTRVLVRSNGMTNHFPTRSLDVLQVCVQLGPRVRTR